MFVKNMKLPILLDVYGALLTERQYELLDLYYNEDLSLSEIAENTGLSRQGVRDAVKKAENELSGFEDKLGFVEKKEETDRLLAEAERIAKELPDEMSVELREENACDFELFVERFRDVDGVLTGHCVDDEDDLGRSDRGLDRLQFVHEYFVDVETSGGIEEDHVVSVLNGVLDALRGDPDRIVLAHLEDGNADLISDDFQLIYRGGAVNVARDEKGILTLLLLEEREFPAVSSFTGTLKADHHHDRRRFRGDNEFFIF